MAPVRAVQDVLGAVGTTPTWSYRDLCNMQATDPIISQVLAPERPSATCRAMESSSQIDYLSQYLAPAGPR